MIDIYQYIGKSPDEILESIRELHDQRAKLNPIVNDKYVREELDSLLSELTIKERVNKPSLSRIEAEGNAKCSKKYRDKLLYFQEKSAQASIVNDEYWVRCREFEYAMKLIDFVRQETFIMNRSK